MGSFTDCEHTLVFPGRCLRKWDSGQCLCFYNLSKLSMTRLVFRWHQNKWLSCSQWPGGHRPFLQLHCAAVLQTEGGFNCYQHSIYDSHHRFTSTAKTALIWFLINTFNHSWQSFRFVSIICSHTLMEKQKLELMAVYLQKQSPKLIEEAHFWCRAHCIISTIVPVPAEV